MLLAGRGPFIQNTVSADPAGKSFYENFTSDGIGSILTTSYRGGVTHYMCTLSSTRAMLLGKNDDNDVYAILYSISGTTITEEDAEQLTSTYNPGWQSICALTSTKAIGCYEDRDTGKGYGRIIDATGDTLTAGTEFEFDSSSTGRIFPGCVFAMADDTAIVCYRDTDDNYPQIQVLDISGTTITGNTPIVLETAPMTYIGGTRIDSDTCNVVWMNSAISDIKGSCVTLPSTQETPQVIKNLSNTPNVQLTSDHNRYIHHPESSLGSAVYSDADSTVTVRAHVATVSGNTATWGSDTEVTNPIAPQAGYPLSCMFGSEYGVISYRSGTSSDYRTMLVPYKVSGTTITLGTDVQIVDNNNGWGRPQPVALGDNKIILFVRQSNGDYGLVVLEDQ